MLRRKKWLLKSSHSHDSYFQVRLCKADSQILKYSGTNLFTKSISHLFL